MKRIFKSTLAVTLCLVMLLGVVAIGGNGFADILSLKASAAKVTSYSVGDKITFGWYPQSKVDETEEAALITALNNADTTWYSYGYYSGTGSWNDGNMTPSDYMKYTDVMYGGNKYRGVYFTSYRPYYTGYTFSTSNTYQDDNGYYTNTVYWFKYEPIKWRVLDPETGMVMCDTILDSQPFNNYILSSGTDEYSKTAYWGNSSKTYYSNNYAESSIRQWLNNDFYNTAFSPAQQNIIAYTELDNKAYSTKYSAYDSETTNDKIYLLSWDDVLNSDYGFSTSSGTYDSARQLKGSDYAKCQGLYVYKNTGRYYDGCSHWRLRSAGFGSSSTCGVGYDGDAYNGPCSTCDAYYGVCAAFNFNLKSEIFQSDVSETGTGSGHSTGSKIPDDAVIFNGHSYKVYSDSKKWTEAEPYCESLGGHLVTITSAKEQDFVKNTLYSLGTKYNYWIGLYDDGTNKNWKWITGEKLEYTNWAGDEPTDPGQDYAMMTSGGGWMDNPNSGHSGKWSLSNTGFICEWDYCKLEDEMSAESFLLNGNSYKYSKNLALYCCDLCAAANKKINEVIKARYTGNGYKDIVTWHYENDNDGSKYSAFTIGYKVVGDTAILAITTRGTQYFTEGIGDFFHGGNDPFLGTEIFHNVYDYEE